MSEPRYPFWMRLAAPLGAATLYGIGGTWRVDRSGMAAYHAEIERGRRCIFAFWHSRLLALAYAHRGRGAAILVSRHRDGELIARVAEHLGYVAARGSSTRGGEEGLREMIEWARRGRLLGFTPDGPRGPAERVKDGLVYLASRTGLPVVPAAASAAPVWRLRSWDGFQVPRPFAKVAIGYAAEIVVPADLDRDGLEAWRVRIEEAIAGLTRDLDRRMESGS